MRLLHVDADCEGYLKKRTAVTAHTKGHCSDARHDNELIKSMRSLMYASTSCAADPRTALLRFLLRILSCMLFMTASVVRRCCHTAASLSRGTSCDVRKKCDQSGASVTAVLE